MGDACVFPFRLLSGEVPRAGRAGQAWILGGRAVDGFEQCLIFQFSGVFASRAFLFSSVSSDLRTNAGIGRKVPFNFYNLINISRAGHPNCFSLID
jgi:hypothetical protein